MKTFLPLLFILLGFNSFSQSCIPGKYSTGGVCVDCPPGNYCPGGNPGLIFPCPTGSYQPNTGSTSCITCPAGTYQSNQGSTFCDNCPGIKTSQPGSTQKRDCTNAPLPVSILFFNSTVYTKGVWLTWATAQEINNDRFEIQRSNGGNAFVSIGQLKGYGNTSVTSNYYFTDSLPMSGLNLYRLKQVDFNGNISYSDIKHVMFNGVSFTSITPNPAVNYIRIKNEITKIEKVNIYNTEGKLVISEKLNSPQKDINISNIMAGSYFVEIWIDGKRFTQKLFKL